MPPSRASPYKAYTRLSPFQIRSGELQSCERLQCMGVFRSQINSLINDAELRQAWDLIDLRPTARWAILAMTISSAIRLFLAYVLDWEQSRYLSAASLMGLWLSSRGRAKLGLITALTAILCTCALSSYISYSGRDRWPWLCPRGCARRRQGR